MFSIGGDLTELLLELLGPTSSVFFFFHLGCVSRRISSLLEIILIYSNWKYYQCEWTNNGGPKPGQKGRRGALMKPMRIII